MSPRNRRHLVITQGDPTGIGPELILRCAALGHVCAGDVVMADPQRLEALARSLRTPWAQSGFEAVAPRVEGEPGLQQFEALRRGVDRVLSQSDTALVTAPIDKARAQAEGLAFPGHTEYLAARSGDPPVAMLMCGPKLRVVLATIHIPLREVARQLSTADVVRAGDLLAHALVETFGVATPRVGVLGLNPHAGERGHIGDEESTVIEPAIAQLRSMWGDRVQFVGPLPGDTAFHAHLRGDFDGLVAMYHDQGLGPFKLVHFSDGVNMTLGLPYVRTSPDHGTAMDIAGKGVADPSSMIAAIEMARGEAA
jgi:4-hydroxythreonine-4-phosphate dehydrogenase